MIILKSNLTRLWVLSAVLAVALQLPQSTAALHSLRNTQQRQVLNEELDHLNPITEHYDQQSLEELANRMKPRNFYAEAFESALPDTSTDPDGDNNQSPQEIKLQIEATTGTPLQVAVPPKQFFHLHHMKTGGTSLNSHIYCTSSRAKKHYGITDQKQYSLSECGFNSYQRCMNEPSNPCVDRIAAAATMQFCAPLYATEKFDWSNADAVTMLRHPVDRIWSMYRFQTKSCFHCHSLKEVYEIMDDKGLNATGDELGGGVCLMQLVNHLTRNLQSTIDGGDDWSSVDAAYDEERLEDALHNLRNRFTVVGLLERLEDSVDLLSHSFPWMTPQIDSWEDQRDVVCNFPQHNSSPTNNRCGPDGKSHMDLPPHPDDETRKIIEEHNKLDIRLYEAAVEHFEMQMKAVEYWNDVQ